MPFDFVKNPELRNSEMDEFYLESPHKQIFEDFPAKCVKVVDGDTLRLMWSERDFDFPIRIRGIIDSEMREARGKEVQRWVKNLLLDKNVDILIDPDNRVEKWGRLLGDVLIDGLDVGEILMQNGMATTFEARDEGKFPIENKLFSIKQWY